MPEYIEREAAIKAVMAAKWEIGSDGAMAMEIVASPPAAKVAPVVHGRWTAIGADKRGRGAIYKCSACNDCYPHVCKFCPNCGAKMEEG